MLCRPYDRVGVVVDNDRDVLVAFLIAGLVNADVYKAVKPAGTFGFNVIEGAVDAPADGFPVDTHVLGDSASGKIYRKPPDLEVKDLREAGSRICPWDVSDKDALPP